MPSRKQKRREAKAKRHEYEFVYLDSEGHELEEPPEEASARAKPRAASTNGSKPSGGKQSSRPARGARRTLQSGDIRSVGRRMTGDREHVRQSARRDRRHGSAPASARCSSA